MLPLAFNLGPTELLIILAIVLLLFGGSRLAGLGKSTGRALKEFKEETKGLKAGEQPPAGPAAVAHDPTVAGTQVPPTQQYTAPADPYTPPVDPYAGQADPQSPAGSHPVDGDRR